MNNNITCKVISLFIHILLWGHASIAKEFKRTYYSAKVYIEIVSEDLPTLGIVDLFIDDRVYKGYGEDYDYRDWLMPGSEKRTERRTFQVINHRVIIELNNFLEPRYTTFRINGRSLTEMNISFPVSYLLPGDSVRLTKTKEQWIFSGRGADRFQLGSKLKIVQRSASNLFLNVQLMEKSPPPDSLIRISKQLDTIADEQLKLIDRFRSVSPEDRFLDSVEIIYANWGTKSSMWYMFRGKGGEANRLEVDSCYRDPVWNEVFIKSTINNEISKHSFRFQSLLVISFYRDSCAIYGKGFDMQRYYDFVTSTTEGSLREFLLVEGVSRYFNLEALPGTAAICIDKALKKEYIKNKSIKAYFLNLKDNAVTGVKAQDFFLLDESGGKRYLSDFKGKVVLFDFWYIGCTPCASLHPLLDSLKKKLKDYPFELISICMLNASENEKNWISAIRSNRYTSSETINLLFDTLAKNRFDVCKVYHVFSAPTLILVDKKGVVVAKLNAEIRQDRTKIVDSLEKVILRYL